jgi:hypothetical protein
MGADVTVISHSPKKKEDALKVLVLHGVSDGSSGHPTLSTQERRISPRNMRMSSISLLALQMQVKRISLLMNTYRIIFPRARSQIEC